MRFLPRPTHGGGSPCGVRSGTSASHATWARSGGGVFRSSHWRSRSFVASFPALPALLPRIALTLRMVCGKKGNRWRRNERNSRRRRVKYHLPFLLFLLLLITFQRAAESTYLRLVLGCQMLLLTFTTAFVVRFELWYRHICTHRGHQFAKLISWLH